MVTRTHVRVVGRSKKMKAAVARRQIRQATCSEMARSLYPHVEGALPSRNSVDMRTQQ